MSGITTYNGFFILLFNQRMGAVTNIQDNALFRAKLMPSQKGVLMISTLRYKNTRGEIEMHSDPEDMVTQDKIPVKYAIIAQGGLYDARTLVEMTRTADFQTRKKIVDNRRKLTKQILEKEYKDMLDEEQTGKPAPDRYDEWKEAEYFPKPFIPHNNLKLPQFVSATLHQVAIALTSQPRIIFKRINKKKQHLKITFENIWISCMNGQLRTYGTYVIVKENVEHILANAVLMSQPIYEALRDNRQLRDAFHPSNKDNVERALGKTLIVSNFILKIDFGNKDSARKKDELRVLVRRDLTIQIAFPEESLTPRMKKALERLKLRTMVVYQNQHSTSRGFVTGQSVDVVEHSKQK